MPVTRIQDAAPIYGNEEIAFYKCPHCGKVRILPYSERDGNKSRCNGIENEDTHDPRQVEWELAEAVPERMKITGNGLEIEGGYIGKASEFFND